MSPRRLLPPAEDAMSPHAPRDVAPPALLVVADPWLLRAIASYQTGLPVALREFCVAHDPKPTYGPTKTWFQTKAARKRLGHLLKLLVESGVPYHLTLFQSIRYKVYGEWHAPQLHRLVSLSVERDRVDLLEWAVANDLSLGKRRSLWKQAITNGAAATLAWLLEHQPLPQAQIKTLLGSEMATPIVPLLEWVYVTFPNMQLPMRMLLDAAGNGDLAVVRVLLEQRLTAPCDPQAFREAHENSHLDVLEYLVTHHAGDLPNTDKKRLVMDPEPAIQAIVAASTEVFAPAFDALFHDAACAGDRKRMNDLFVRGVISGPISIDEVFSWKGLDGVAFLQERGLASGSASAMDLAAENKRWDLVDFLQAHRTEGWTTRAADAAAGSGHIKYLRLFLENLSGSCTAKGMDAAAGQGHLNVVKFLHENRSEGCTADAMDGAARGGFAEVVEYLCEHRSEGCTVDGIKAALEHNRLEVVQLLYKKYPHHFGPALLSDLLLRGAFDIFMDLRETYPEEAGSIVESVLYEAAKQLEARTIRFIMTTLMRWDLRQFALNGADKYKGAKCGLWQGVVDVLTRSPDSRAKATTTPLHPFLLDARTPKWTVDEIFGTHQSPMTESNGPLSPTSWAIRSVHRRDFAVLQVIRDLPVDANEWLFGKYFSPSRGYQPFSFAGARAEAICQGDRPMLEWLLTNIQFPIEPTLLGEAIYYHQYNIAEWLVTNYPAACTEVDWTSKESGPSLGLGPDLLSWLQEHDNVRRALSFALSFTGIIDFAARTNDVASLKQLHDWHPELFKPRPALVALADREEYRDAINFFLDIGWSSSVFLEEQGWVGIE